MSDHIVPRRVYYLIFAALIVLTITTVAADFVDLGRFQAVVGLSIAVAKASLVVLYFMHLRYSDKLNWVVAGGGLLWLGILFALTLSDYMSRSWLPVAGR